MTMSRLVLTFFAIAALVNADKIGSLKKAVVEAEEPVAVSFLQVASKFVRRRTGAVQMPEQEGPPMALIQFAQQEQLQARQEAAADTTDDWCQTTMAACGVSSCWDLSVALGLKGFEHITNSRLNSGCGRGKPFPDDIMMFRCSQMGEAADEMANVSPTELIQLQQQQAALLEIQSGAQAEANAVGAPIIANSVCQATMQMYGVTGCWDFAEAIGLEGSQHSAIINTRTGQPCSSYTPYIEDVMQFPCEI